MRLLTLPRLALLAAVLCAARPGAAADDALARIGAQLGQHEVVRAEFTQTREMAVMKRPLVSAGRLVYSKAHGVLWQMDQPHRMSYLVSEERIVEIGADGARRERRLRDMPGLAQVNRVLRALFSADAAVLRENFEVALRGDASAWEMDLKPRQPQVAQLLTALQVSGGRFVEAIRIDEAGGDLTQIHFRNSQSVAAPSAEEMLLFGDISPAPQRPAKP